MPNDLSGLSRHGRLYLLTVIALGAGAIWYSVHTLIQQPTGWNWLVLGALTVLTGSFSIKIPSVSARLSVSEAFVFTAVLLYGLPVATAIVALDSLILTSWLRRGHRSALRGMFNMAAGAVSIFVAALVLEAVVDFRPAATTPLDELVLPVLLMAVTYFAINSSLIAFAVAIDQRGSAFKIWQNNFLWFGLNYLGGASAALVLISFAEEINIASVGIIIPLVVILYLTFRTTWGRVEDANRHVAQVNELYLSTIEALAMAVDAKDQITHGHIRRVQVYAVELAKKLGVDDGAQLQAIATAALLHDMGKLAIPEHILNKPGKLSPAEFKKMKRHADIGADLLSSVKFPYPVVPIVRHHHERWDGTGYPTGISGPDIPLGARILGVVDCFDALTSDRPYRPRLSSHEAFEIIRQQRGTTYDPLIVDTFIRVHAEIAPGAVKAGQQAHSIVNAAMFDVDEADDPLNHIRANAAETTILDNFAKELSRAATVNSAFEAVAQHLRQLTPGAVYALFAHDSSLDLLRCIATSGDNQHRLDGFTIRLGERISGWVAANKTVSINSNPSLDLAQMAGYFDLPLLSTLSVPLVADDQLIGVLTSYASEPDTFDDNHRYSFERVAVAFTQKLTALHRPTPSHLLPFSSHKRPFSR